MTPDLRVRDQRFLVDAGGRRLLVGAPADRHIMAGDTVRLTGVIEQIVEQEGRLGYWHRRGITHRMYVTWEGSLEVLAPGGGIASIGSQWRTDTYERLRRHMQHQQAGLVMGMIAGQQGLVDDEVRADMERSGTLHLLATSGFNVMLVAAGLMLLLQHVPVPRPLQVAIALALLFAYCAAVGMKPPVVRAAVMCSVFLGSLAVGRQPDALSAVAIAAIGYAFWEPGSALDAGFQLSFGAVFALILYSPYIVRKLIRKTARVRSEVGRLAFQWVGASVAVTLVAIAGTAPLSAAHFGQVSFVSPLANLATAPVVGAMYVLAALGQLFAPIAEPVSSGCDGLAGLLAGWVIDANAYFADLPWSSETFAPISGWLCAAWYVLLILASPRERLTGEELEARAATEP
jgi:competence protein ComEC